MSYALLPQNKGYFYTHVAFMVMAFWILMPMGKNSKDKKKEGRGSCSILTRVLFLIGVMFGIARSSLHVPTQIIAFITSLVGYFFGHLYAHNTPHLYTGNVHHKLGWIIFLFLVAQMAVGVVRKIANAVGKTQPNHLYESLPEENMVASRQQEDSQSEGSMETLQNNHLDRFPPSPPPAKEVDGDNNVAQLLLDEEDDDCHDSVIQDDKRPSLWMRAIHTVLPYIPRFVKILFVRTAYNPFTKTICRYLHSILGRVFVVLIFTQTLSGLVVYHGVCR
jgi:hypothetical protein